MRVLFFCKLSFCHFVILSFCHFRVSDDNAYKLKDHA